MLGDDCKCGLFVVMCKEGNYVKVVRWICVLIKFKIISSCLWKIRECKSIDIWVIKVVM